MKILHRKRGTGHVWLLVKKFEDCKEAKQELKDWSISSTKKTIQGEIVEYRCKKGNYRRNDCPVYMQLLYHSDSSSASIYKTDAEHEHNEHENNIRGLNNELKEFIKKKI